MTVLIMSSSSSSSSALAAAASSSDMKFPLPNLSTLKSDAFSVWMKATKQHVAEHFSQLIIVFSHMRLPDYVISRTPSDSMKDITAYGSGACPYKANPDESIRWVSAHIHAIKKVQEENPTYTTKECTRVLGNYSDKNSWELTQFNHYFKQVSEIIPKLRNRFDTSVVAVIESNAIMTLAENKLDLISWISELKNICSSSSGHAVASLEEARNKMRGLRMIGDNFEDYASRFMESVDIVKSSPENRTTEREYIETFLAGLNDKQVTHHATPLLNKYLENEKESSISQCKNLAEMIGYVKRYITDVTKPARKLRSVNSEYFTKDTGVESPRPDPPAANGSTSLSNKSAKGDKPVVQSTLTIGKGNNAPDSTNELVLQQVLSRLNSLQSDMKTNKKNFKTFQRDFQKDSKLTETRVSAHANATTGFNNKRKSEEMSEVSTTDSSVCPVFLATGKCSRKGCTLPHLDETKKKAFLANWSSTNSSGN